MRRPPRRQRGVALILVLWVSALLAVIAGSFAFATRADLLAVQVSVVRARAEAAADAGVVRALYELSKPNEDTSRWQADGAPHELAFGEARVVVRATDESGKIDLNAAPDELLHGLFLSAGLAPQAAEALVEAMKDWRDEDGLSRPNGAEAPQYRAAGLPYSPANAPFRAIEELQLVLGMDPRAYRRVAGAITVHSRRPGLAVQIAPRAALFALPGVNAEAVDGYLALRDAARAAGQPMPVFAPAARFDGLAYNFAYGLRAEARLADGALFVREAVVQILPEPKRPFAVLAWREAADSGSPGNDQVKNR